MENKSGFNLETALAAWRKQLEHSVLTGDNVRELEAHLRDSVSRIHESGVSEEDSFAIGVYRLGQAGPLATEFAKAHPERIWFQRVLWMLLGAQVFSILTQCANAVRGLISVPQVILRHSAGPTDGFYPQLLWGSEYLVLGGLLIAAFKLLQWKRWVWDDLVQALCRRPGKWCTRLAGASVLMAMASFGASLLPMLVENWWSNWLNSGPGGSTHYHYPSLVLMLTVSCANATLIPLLTFLFLRRRSAGGLDPVTL